MGNKGIEGTSVQDIEVGTFRDVDISDIRLTMIAVYEYPADYPGYYIGRIFDADRPTNVIIKKGSAEGVRKEIYAAFPYMARIKRGEADVKSLVEVWI